MFAAVALVFAVGCSSSTDEQDPSADPPSEAGAPSDAGREVLARVRVPAEWPGDWTAEGEAVQHIVHGARIGVLFDPGEDQGSVTAPIPEGAASARTLRLELMSDGPFVMELACGDRQGFLRGADTRRRSRVFEVELGDPKGEPATVLTIHRLSSDFPVLLERISFVE